MKLFLKCSLLLSVAFVIAPLCAMGNQELQQVGWLEPKKAPSLQQLAATAALSRFNDRQIDGKEPLPTDVPQTLQPRLLDAKKAPIREIIKRISHTSDGKCLIDLARKFCEDPDNFEISDRINLITAACGCTPATPLVKKLVCYDYIVVLQDGLRNAALSNCSEAITYLLDYTARFPTRFYAPQTGEDIEFALLFTTPIEKSYWTLQRALFTRRFRGFFHSITSHKQ